MTDTLIQALAAEITPPDGTGHQWVHLLPLGEVEARDGRRFPLPDPEAIIAAFTDNAVDLPVDYEYQTEKDPNDPAPVPVAGRIKQLDLRTDGIWGRVHWTDKAAAMIQARIPLSQSGLSA